MNTEGKRVNFKDMPPEFFLPPADNADLWRETRMLILLSTAFIVVLAILVALTQGVVVKL